MERLALQQLAKVGLSLRASAGTELGHAAREQLSILRRYRRGRRNGRAATKLVFSPAAAGAEIVPAEP